jgi:hypothetical protein
MKQLDIPLILQQKGSVDCGPTCVRMVLEYFGIKKSLEQLQKKLHYDEIGTSIFDNGSLLLDEGLKTSIITAQPLLFPPDIIQTLHSKEGIQHFVQKKIKENHNQKQILETFDTYLQKGGDVKLEIPVFSHVQKALDAGNPVIAGMYAQSLGSTEGKYHFVIISGYRNNEVHITNSWLPSKHQDWFSWDQFIFGVYASTCVAVDNGSFLIVSK